MEEKNLINVAQKIATGKELSDKKCPYYLPNTITILVLNEKLNQLIYCPQLQNYKLGRMSKITCQYLFRVGRGCPFVLSGNTCFSDSFDEE